MMTKNEQFKEITQKMLINFLESYTNKKIILEDRNQLEEVKRKKMTKPSEVGKYVLFLLKKFSIRENVRVTATGNVIKVEQKDKENISLPLKSLAAELVEEGFKYGTDKKLGEKTFIQLIDKKYRLIVLLPFFKKPVIK